MEIIHNDLKPQNCLVDSSWTVKIADFGLSRLKAKGVTVVERGKGVGSPYYMSPEALQEHYQVDKSTDVRHLTEYRLIGTLGLLLCDRSLGDSYS